jgi:hypothetical protein
MLKRKKNFSVFTTSWWDLNPRLVGGDIQNKLVVDRRIPRFERALAEKAYPSWDSQKLLTTWTHVMLRKGVARVESHFLAAAWALRSNSLHSFASTNYSRFRRDGVFDRFLDLARQFPSEPV